MLASRARGQEAHVLAQSHGVEQDEIDVEAVDDPREPPSQGCREQHRLLQAGPSRNCPAHDRGQLVPRRDRRQPRQVHREERRGRLVLRADQHVVHRVWSQLVSPVVDDPGQDDVLARGNGIGIHRTHDGDAVNPRNCRCLHCVTRPLSFPGRSGVRRGRRTAPSWAGCRGVLSGFARCPSPESARNRRNASEFRCAPQCDMVECIGRMTRSRSGGSLCRRGDSSHGVGGLRRCRGARRIRVSSLVTAGVVTISGAIGAGGRARQRKSHIMDNSGIGQIGR